MANANQTRQTKEKQKLIVVTISTGIVIALLAAYAFFATPEAFQPVEVKITGTVTATGATMNKIAFTNTGCGTRGEAQISPSGAYAIVLDNEYTYNVTIAYTDSSGATAEAEAGTLVLNTQERTLTRNWTIQP